MRIGVRVRARARGLLAKVGVVVMAMMGFIVLLWYCLYL